MEAPVTEYRTIEIDFDVHKLIENERCSFGEKPNDALRRLLKLPSRTPEQPPQAATAVGRSWSGEGVTLPHGTRLRMRYNGRLYEGEIADGKWVIEGRMFGTPSGAASGIAITKRGKKTRLDGWIYWEVQSLGENTWSPIASLRPKQNGVSVTLAELEALGL
jgi:hypothetical protein